MFADGKDAALRVFPQGLGPHSQLPQSNRGREVSFNCVHAGCVAHGISVNGGAVGFLQNSVRGHLKEHNERGLTVGTPALGSDVSMHRSAITSEAAPLTMHKDTTLDANGFKRFGCRFSFVE